MNVRMRPLLALIALHTCAACTYLPGRTTEPPPQPESPRAAFEGFAAEDGPSGLTMLSDNALAWAARWEAMETAQRSIDASYFIVRNDVFGFAFLGHLLVRAREGVQVRLLIDARGSLDLSSPLLGRDFLQELVETGNVDVRIFNPPVGQLLSSLAEASLVPVSAGTHNKILVVDGQLAFTGGRNIGRQYFTDFAEDQGSAYDSDVMIDGAALDPLVDAMDAEWGAAQAEVLPRDLVNFRSQADELVMIHAAMAAWLHGDVDLAPPEEAAQALEAAALASFAKLPEPDRREQIRPHLTHLARMHALRGILPLPSLPRHEGEARVVSAIGRAQGVDDTANDALLRALGSAQNDIVMQSPYLVLTPRHLKALVAASHRGVRITILTNSAMSSDNTAAQALFVDTWPELEARAPTLRIFVGVTKQMLHAKRAVIDDELTLIGTYNLDPFSAHVNSEMFVAGWSAGLNAQTRAEMGALIRGMIEYRIARDENGRALRHPPGHPEAGRPIIAFGPQHHLPPGMLDELRAMKSLLIGIRGLWDFEVVVW